MYCTKIKMFLGWCSQYFLKFSCEAKVHVVSEFSRKQFAPKYSQIMVLLLVRCGTVFVLVAIALILLDFLIFCSKIFLLQNDYIRADNLKFIILIWNQYVFLIYIDVLCWNSESKMAKTQYYFTDTPIKPLSFLNPKMMIFITKHRTSWLCYQVTIYPF